MDVDVDGQAGCLPLPPPETPNPHRRQRLGGADTAVPEGGDAVVTQSDELSFGHLWLKMTLKGRFADVRELLVFLSLRKKF